MTTVPLFWESEIRCGRELGKGTYCTVTAVKDILLLSEDECIPQLTMHTGTRTRTQTNDDQAVTSNNNSDAVQASRQRLAQKFAATRHKKPDLNAAIYGKPTGPPKEIDDPEEEPAPRLALKRVRKEVLTSSSPTDQQIARADFLLELDILRTISSHPNIVDLRGIGFDPTTHEPSCLLLGQIRTTLARRILRWRDEKGIGLYEALAWNLVNRKNQWVERLVVLSKLAHAVQHMHSHQILYRDIKPENVGFDAVLDIPKVFDFGLAKRISDPEDASEDGLFHLTPETGTLRYMAVEVGTNKAYGWTADVYSLAILIHEVLSLKAPFGASIRPTQFRELVWTQGERLPLDPTWPCTILDLLPRMWHSDPLERPPMGEVAIVLDGMLRGTDEELFPTNLATRRRGPFSLFS